MCDRFIPEKTLVILTRSAVCGGMLFGMVTIVYGYLAGSSLYIGFVLHGRAALGLVVASVLVFCVYSVAKYAGSTGFRYGVWVYGGSMCMVLPLCLVCISGDSQDWGSVFRIHVFTTAMYVTPAAAFLLARRQNTSVSCNLRGTKFHQVHSILALVSFSLGVTLFFGKSGLSLQGNDNFLSQFALAQFCVVMPLCAGSTTLLGEWLASRT